MPTWVTRFTTIGQIVLVVVGVTAIVVLAIRGIIGGDAAITSILLILGIGGAVQATVQVAHATQQHNGDASTEVK